MGGAQRTADPVEVHELTTRRSAFTIYLTPSYTEAD